MIKINYNEHDGDWISISDLMSGLMIIFLFIAICYMNHLQARANQIKRIAVAYQEVQESLYKDLYDEFKDDLDKWKAEISKDTLSVRFNEPDVLFLAGSYEVTDKFRSILKDFFPRYISIMNSPKYQDNIEEIRIEGHTSSEWSEDVNRRDAYYLNMKLSQDRTRSVLKYCIDMINNEGKKEWAVKYLTANGLSSSRVIITDDGKENKPRSRRVEFRTKTAAEKKVVEIIEEIKKNENNPA